MWVTIVSMAVKYKNYLKEMYIKHSELFDSFETIHAAYVLDKATHQAEFNRQGQEVLRVVEDWENRLCNQMEKGKHSSFSHRLADKFREELRIRFPMIDFVGAKIKPAADFVIPRINLS